MIAFSKPTFYGDGVKALFGNSSDLNIYHDSSNSLILNDTGRLIIRNRANDSDIEFDCDDGSGGTATYFYLDGGRSDGTNLATRFPDGSIILLGSGTGWNDGAQIYHSGSNFYLNEYVGNIEITCHTTDGDIKFKSDDGSGGETEYFRVDGGDGINYFFKDVKFLDNGKIKFGTGTDLQIYHNATNSLIENSTGDFYISNKHDGGDIIFFCDDGSGGTAQYFRVDGGSVETQFLKSTLHFDSVKAKFGDSGDLQIYHNGSNSYIQDAGTGSLKILAQDLDINNAAETASMIRAIDGAQVELYYGGGKKLETKSTGINIQGVTEYANNTAALAGGLVVGDVYRTGDDLKIVH